MTISSYKRDRFDDISIGFDFRKLSGNAKVVDVGSGVGAVSFALAKAHPHLNLILQDRPEVINGAAKAVSSVDMKYCCFDS